MQLEGFAAGPEQSRSGRKPLPLRSGAESCGVIGGYSVYISIVCTRRHRREYDVTPSYPRHTVISGLLF